MRGTNAGIKRGRMSHPRAARIRQVQKAQEQLLQLQPATGTDRKTKTRAGRAEPAPGRTGTWPGRDDRQANALAGGVGARSLRDAEASSNNCGRRGRAFGQHLEVMEGIDPKGWNPADLHRELSRALSTVDDARAEFSQQRSRLQAIATQERKRALPEAAPDVAEMLARSHRLGNGS